MKIASAESARALTQAVLLARLCGRYHDLESYASELLKQRIHFLVKPDGSNLKELLIWDLPSSASSSSSSSTTSWTTAQIDEYIQEHWSADQFPLTTPNHARSWEEADVYYKALDADTVQAIIPIGHRDGATLAVVLQAETEDSAVTKDEACWKYHNMAVVRERDLKAQGWNILLDQTLHPSNDSSPRASMEVSRNDESKGGDDGKDEAESDDDYWGQYGDSEEEDSSTEEHMGQDEPIKDLTEVTSVAAHDEDEDEYWRKYAEHQEQQEELERKRKLKQQQQHQQADLQEQGLQQQERINAVASRTVASTPIGQVDPTMLSSLLQMLAAESTVNLSPSGQTAHADPAHMQTIPVDASVVTPSTAPLSRDGNSRRNVLNSMRLMVDQATHAGYSKDEVFEMLSSIYNTPE